MLCMHLSIPCVRVYAWCMETEGAQLKRMRLDRGWSIRELARQSGIDPTAISAIERGKRQPFAKTWKKLMDALSGAERDAWIRGYASALVDRGAMWDEAMAKATKRWHGEEQAPAEGEWDG